jgi:putative ABC transport system permease protein
MFGRVTFVDRCVSYYWRINLAVALGVVAATTTLTGALIVGDSMRASLRDHAMARLCDVRFSVQTPRFLTDTFASKLVDRGGLPSEDVWDTVLTRASVSNATTRAMAGGVQLIGVDERCWLTGFDLLDPHDVVNRRVVINAPLAGELGVAVGDDLLLRMARPPSISAETVLGRRDESAAAIRVTVGRIIPADGAGQFSLVATNATPLNLFIDLATLQRTLGRPGRINTVLVRGDVSLASLTDAVNSAHSPQDAGITVTRHNDLGYVAVQSDRFLIPPTIDAVIDRAAESLGLAATRSLVYLANKITLSDSQPVRSIPYSTVAAIDDATIQRITADSANPIRRLSAHDIVLIEWAADDLDAHLGDTVALEYYVNDANGRLETRTSSFTVRAILGMNDRTVDDGFTPTYPGVTDARSIADWDPPFPIDLNTVRDKDDDYWDLHRAAPKAFVALSVGRSLWAEDPVRFGATSSVRLYSDDSTDVDSVATRFLTAIDRTLDPASLGLRVSDVRGIALTAGAGSTDFGGLFVGFSLFLVVGASLLVSMMFKLNIERRSPQLGALYSMGFTTQTIRNMLLAEGVVISLIAGIPGVLCARFYADAMIAGLKTSWSQAANAPFLAVHIEPGTLVVGFLASLTVASITAMWSVREMSRVSTRSIVSGQSQLMDTISPSRWPLVSRFMPWALLIAAIALASAPKLFHSPSESIAFFGSGALTLLAGLSGVRLFVRRPRPNGHAPSDSLSAASLVFRNAARNPSRTVTTMSLIACATFVIASMQAFHMGVEPSGSSRNSSTGGYEWMAESAAPLFHDLGTRTGRRELSLDNIEPAMAGTVVDAFRLKPGDDPSCNNLYVPTQPRILGASPSFIARDAFRFSSWVETDADHAGNPWSLLTRKLNDGAIPVIGDEAAVKWQLHSGLGQDLTITDDTGQPTTIRFVALLSGSALQGEIIMSERNFTRLFPSVEGYNVFLLTKPPNGPARLPSQLEAGLDQYGFDVRLLSDRLAGYFAVQNTYLKTFQALGSLGLVLGSLGLASVMLRNVWERKGEIALLRAVGFRRTTIGLIVQGENVLLVGCGLLIGATSAAVAVAPHLLRNPGVIPWPSIVLTLLAVLIIGVLAGSAALVPVYRSSVLDGLRSE